MRSNSTASTCKLNPSDILNQLSLSNNNNNNDNNSNSNNNSNDIVNVSFVNNDNDNGNGNANTNRNRAKSSGSSAKQDRIEQQYQKRNGWIVFIVLLVFVLGLNVPFLALVFNLGGAEYDLLTEYLIALTPVGSAATTVATLAPSLELYYNQSQQGNTTATTLLETFTTANTTLHTSLQNVANVEEKANTAFKYSLVTGLCSLFIVLVVMVYVIINRHSRIIRSRGVYFLSQLFIMSILGLIMSIIRTGVWCFQYHDIMMGEFSDYLDSLYAFSLLYGFFQYGIYAAILCRMRLVYLAFSYEKNAAITAYSYFKPLPFCFLLWVCYMIPITVLLYSGIEVTQQNQEIVDCLCSLLGPVVFTTWIGFYTYKTRSASQEYNDFWINVRNGIFLTFSFSIFQIWHIINGFSMLHIFYHQYVLQAFIVLYILDMFSSLVFLRFVEKRNTQTNGGFLSTRATTYRNKSRDNDTNEQLEHRSTASVLTSIISNNINNEYGKSVVYDGDDYLLSEAEEEIAVVGESDMGMHDNSDNVVVCSDLLGDITNDLKVAAIESI